MNESIRNHSVNISDHRADTVCDRIGQHGGRVDYGEVGVIE